MKVLLILETATDKKMYINQLPSLGILGIASYLISKGIETKAIDCNIQDYDYRDAGDYDIVGFSLFCSNVTRTLAAAKRVKEKFPNVKVVIGGPHVQTAPKKFARKRCVDAVIIGEGEDALYEYAMEGKPQKVRGVYYRDGRKIIFTGERPFREDLDSLPFPALDQVNLNKYIFPISQASPISQIITSRGCPYNCIYCFHSLGKKWRPRSAKNIVDEIEWQVNKLGVREISLSDDNFTLDRKRAEEVCELIIKRKIKVKLQLMNGIRADRVDKVLLEKMKQAGVWLIAVAPETGSEDTLKKIRKGMTLNEPAMVVKWCKELGIATYAFFMIGFPWESENDVKKTIEYAEKLDADFNQFSRVLPFEGTELAKIIGSSTCADKDAGLFYGEKKYKEQRLSDEQTKKLIQEAYRKCYLKPKKMWRIFRILSIKSLFRLGRYAIVTGSI